MCKILVTDGMNKNAVNNLRRFKVDVEHKFYDGIELGEKLKDKDILVIRSKNVITKEIIDKSTIDFINIIYNYIENNKDINYMYVDL